MYLHQTDLENLAKGEQRYFVVNMRERLDDEVDENRRHVLTVVFACGFR